MHYLEIQEASSPHCPLGMPMHVCLWQHMKHVSQKKVCLVSAMQGSYFCQKYSNWRIVNNFIFKVNYR